MTNPLSSSSFKYTIRALTRPEGSDAVERHTVSGWWTDDFWASVNQVLNCLKGELGSSCDSSSAPFVYCSACAFDLSSAGATVCMRQDRGIDGGVAFGGVTYRSFCSHSGNCRGPC